MRKLIIFCFLFIFHLYSCSSTKKISKIFITGYQEILESKAGKSTPYSKSICSKQLNYAPDILHPDHTPIRWVRLNFHFIDRAEGGVNFNEEDGRKFAHRILETGNKRLLKNAKMHLPPDNETPVLPAQYQYVLSGVDEKDDGIYFHKNDDLYVSNKKGGVNSHFAQKQYNKLGIRKGEVINIFFMEHHPDSIASTTYKASWDGVGTPKWAKVIGAYMMHKDNPKMSIDNVADNFSGVFNHEVGHSLGLRHTWRSNDGCDDTPESPNCWNVDKNAENCNEISKVSNNMMDYNAWRTAITPCQIGRVHQKLSDERSIQRKMLVRTWCDYKPEAAIRIARGEQVVWKSAKDLEGDLIIENGANLTLQCILSLPQKAKISVALEGKLLLDGATITNRCGEKWEGIEVEKQGKLKGTVEIVSASRVENAVHEIDFEENKSPLN